MRLSAKTLTVVAATSLIGAMVVVANSPVALATPVPAGTVYTPSTPALTTITNGAHSAPWNEWQGDPASPLYSTVPPGTVLPTYTPGGATTGSGATTEPNVAVVPGAGSGTDGVAPYPSGTVGTPGPLSGYCGTGNQVTASAGTPARQPDGTTLPLAPAYFPHIVANADGSLTGYFDYRPKDADEAVEVAKSTDGGKDWTYEGEALEQNPNYCPSDDTNDDGNGHPIVLTIGGVTRLYTLQRAAGDTQGVGMLVHSLTPTTDNPLTGAPAAESVGIDPDAFVPGGDGVSVPHSGGVTITITSTGSAGSTLQLVPGGFVDLTQTPTPTAASVITCTGVTATTLTVCTSASATGETVNAGDQIEQVIGYVNGAITVPAGPNTSTGDGGLGTINVVTTSGGSTKGFTYSITGTTFNNNAPNRAYINGVAVYCLQANANPTTKMENCTTGPGNPSLSAATGAPITSDPIIPSTATAMTSGLVAPDGIVGVLPSYPGAPVGSTIVMYTEKELNYFVSGTTTNSSSSVFGSTITFTPSPYVSQDLPTPSVANPVTVSMGDSTKAAIISVTCTGMTTGTTDSLTGCTVPSADTGDSYSSTSLIGAPGATTVPSATLALTGEGSTSTAKLFKNNEDLAVVRVAYTTDGVTFSNQGLDNNGIISGQSNGASNYSDLTNTNLTASPSNLNAYATPGTPDAIELRWAGSAGSIITNPDGSYGLFLSGAFAGDGDSDAFNQIFYSSSTDGEHWTVPTTVVSTDYTFAASAAQDAALSGGTDAPLGISAYYSGRAYGPSVVQNADGTLTMLFAGYRIPKTIAAAGTVLGTNTSSPYTVGASDPVAYRNILTETLTTSTSPAVGTQVALTASPDSPTIGQQVTYTATVTVPSPGTGTPTGSVTFTGNGGTLCSAVTVSDTSPDTATCTTTYTSAQTDSVSAVYSGDSNYATSTGTLSETIAPVPSTTTLTADSSSSLAGDSVTYTATVAATGATPTGTVEFSDSGSDLGGCSSVTLGDDLTATCTTSYPSAGTYSVTATYSGDSNVTGSTSDALTHIVTKRGPVVSVSAGTGPFVADQPVTFTATVSDSTTSVVPTGTIEFTSGGTDLPGCSAVNMSAGSATCTVSAGFDAGPVSVVALYSGDSAFAAADNSADPYTITIDPALALSWATPSPITYGTALDSTVLDATANVPGSFTYTITGTDTSIDIGDVLGAGTYSVTATFTPDSDEYSPETVEATIVVNQVPLFIAVNPSTRVYGQADPAFTLTGTGFVNGDSLASLDGTPSFAAVLTTKVGGVRTMIPSSPTSPPGTYHVTASGLSSPNYAITYVTGTMTVTKAALTITVQPSSRTYGQNDPAFLVQYQGLVNGESPSVLGGSLAFTATTSRTSGGVTTTIVSSPTSPVGTYRVVASGLTSSDYTIKYVAGSMQVTKAPLTVTVVSTTKVVGQPNPPFTVTYWGFMNGEDASVLGGALTFRTKALTHSPAGSYPVTATGLTSPDYAITYVPGTLDVTSPGSD